MRITEKQKIDEQFKMMVAVSTHFVTEKKKKGRKYTKNNGNINEIENTRTHKHTANEQTSKRK